MTIDDAEEKVTLQVRQARFKYNEAFNTYDKAQSAIRISTYFSQHTSFYWIKNMLFYPVQWIYWINLWSMLRGLEFELG